MRDIDFPRGQPPPPANQGNMSGNTRGWIGGDGLDSLPRGGEKKITALSKVPRKGVGN